MASKDVVIEIDNEPYRVPAKTMTGAQLRSVPPSPIDPAFDLYEVRVDDDILVQEDVTYSLKNGLQFFTVPSFWS